MTETKTSSALNSSFPKRIFIPAMLLGIWATYLFFMRPPGISVFIFMTTSFTILFGIAWLNNIKPSWRSVWLVIPALLFASLVAIRANGFTTFLNLSATLVLSLLTAYLFQQGDIFKFGILNYISAGIQSSIEISILRPPSAAVNAWKDTQQNGGLSPRLAAVFRGSLLSFPIVILFAILFSSADAVYESSVRDILKILRLDNLPELFSRLVFTAMTAWFCLGGLAYALRKGSLNSANIEQASQPRRPIGFIETVVILVSLNVLFASFVIVQFRYFFGGQHNISIAGFTYAEYVRRGFAELVFVAIFTLGICLVLQAVTRKVTLANHRIFEGMVTLLVVFTGVILVSAFQRLVLYEQAYGWTQLRTYVHVFMLCIGTLLLVFLISVHFSNPRLFAFGLFITCLGFTLILNILNTDAFIARQNIARYAATGKIDVVYLASLSEDAIPELLWLLDATGGDDSQVIGSALHDYLNRLEESQSQVGWQAWNWSRANALYMLQEAEPILEKYPAQRYFWRFPFD